jgi:hypothetical protein
MSSKFFPFDDVINENKDDHGNSYESVADDLDKAIEQCEQADIHCAFHVTLGCPAAHELKYSDGGLRRIFAEIPDTAQKLRWMFAIQSASCKALLELFGSSPREAISLFGSINNKPLSFIVKDEFALIVKRKFEISRRIDMCGSQALGCAVTIVRGVCTLAALYGGQYMDILARSLSTGFLIMFQSMLSTCGDELGMIEDLELASLWLSLVAVRLVVVPAGKPLESSDESRGAAPRRSSATQTVMRGVADGIVCQKDVVIGINTHTLFRNY